MADEESYTSAYKFSPTERIALLVLAGLLFLGLLIKYGVMAHRTPPRIKISEKEYSYRIDLNRANAAELELLPGIGPKKAQRIVGEREKLGGFRSLSQLEKVLGGKTCEKIKPYITISPPTGAGEGEGLR